MLVGGWNEEIGSQASLARVVVPVRILPLRSVYISPATVVETIHSERGILG